MIDKGFTMITLSEARVRRSTEDHAAGPTLPCSVHDPDLWFSDAPAELERAKVLCRDCPIRGSCLELALDRHESCGVWGGEVLRDGVVVPYKRGPGRPRKSAAA
jgi:WhiB family redox-sensing transcriptional regulator